MNNFKAVLTTKNQLTPDVILFNFKLEDQKEILFKAGQYVIVSVPQTDGSIVKRLYSIASPPEQKDGFELLVKLVENGVGTTYLNNIKVGDIVDFSGPAGLFGLRENPKSKVFLATGTGFAPVRSILKSISTKQVTYKIVLFWGMQKSCDFCLSNELKEFTAKISGFSYGICLSRETSLDNVPQEQKDNTFIGRIPVGLDSFFSDKNPNDFDYYICGNRDVVESLRQYLAEKSVAKENIFFERY